MKKNSYSVCSLALLLCMICPSLHAAILYVDVNAPGPTHDGSIWKFAYVTLQDAIDAAAPNDQIWVADGTYLPTKNTSGVATAGRDATFFIDKNIEIYGGFSGNENSLSDRDLGANLSILDGNIGAVGSNADNSYHVVYISSVGTGMVLDGFIVKNGNANGGMNVSETRGGGMYIDGSDGKNTKPQIKNCQVINNIASTGGGGVCNNGSGGVCAPSYVNCVFSNNNAAYGGGVYNDGSFSTYGGGTIGTVYSAFYNCNFYLNLGLSGGNAIFHNTLFSPTANNRNTVANCILWDFLGLGFDLIAGTGSMTSVSYSIFELARMNLGNFPSVVWVDGGNNIDADPGYYKIEGPDNVFGTNDDDYHVGLCSPAIDAGNPSAIVLPSHDMASNKRQHGTVDIGAIEFTGEQELGLKIPITPNTSSAPTKEFTGIDGWTHYCDCSTSPGNLLLSVSKSGHNIGNVGDLGFSLELKVTSLYGTNAGTDLSGANYASGSWWVMNRYWDLNPVQQPTGDVKVRFYYTTQDFTDVQTSYPALTAETDMNFFKTQGAPPHDLNPSVFIAYGHGLTSSSTTWSDGVLADNVFGEAGINGHKYAEYDVSSFSGGGGGGGAGVGPGVFPVELLAFRAEKTPGGNHLEWVTGSELNSAFFEVERSYDGVGFQSISTVAAAGHSQTAIAYAFVDRSFEAARSYYRLKQVDVDGRFEYSSVLEVLNELSREMKIYPNPFSEGVNLFLPRDYEQLHFELMDIYGNKVFDESWTHTYTGEIKINIPEGLASGWYHYRLKERGLPIISGKLTRM